MATDITTEPGFFTGQRRVFLAIFAALFLVLAAAYYLFLRTDYAVLYAGLKPADASAIVAQLDAKGISHRLRDNGTAILVPTDQADNVRLAVAGSEIPMKGAVGFELFNKSDMGLTDFAQKINYQRALQGELARTIMMMEGVESARIHLALPERSLFKSNRSVPKAAVEVIAKLGRSLTPDRVAGIQQLIASSVPDLALGDVVVLDGDGRIISQAPSSEVAQAPEIEEQAAAQNYYSARAKAALANAVPGMQFGVKTLVLPRSSGAGEAPSETGPSAQANAAPATTGKRDFQLRVTVLTEAALNSEDQGIARSAVATAIGLDEQHGDSLLFEVGPTTTPSAAPSLAITPAASPVPPALDGNASTASGWDGAGSSWWPWALAGLAAMIATGLLVRGRRGDLSPLGREAFVDRLRQQIRAEGGRDVRL